MKCVKVVVTEDGGSRFDSTEVEQTPAPYVQNVPPLLLSQPVPMQQLVFMTMPRGLRNTEPHPAPAHQFAIVLEGEFEIETTDGDRRTFPPGGVALFEDTTGRGHITRVLKEPASIVAITFAHE